MLRRYLVESYYNTCRITGLWSTQAKVEGIVLKGAWHTGSDSSVLTIPLGGIRPHPIVCRPSVCVGLREQ